MVAHLLSVADNFIMCYCSPLVVLDLTTFNNMVQSFANSKWIESVYWLTKRHIKQMDKYNKRRGNTYRQKREEWHTTTDKYRS